MNLNSMHELFLQQLKDVYDAENQLIDALPKMADAAAHSDLRNAFTHHLKETMGHVGRLEEVFRKLNRTPERVECKAMKGLLKEGEEILTSNGDPAVKDAALIAAAQRVEHYEIACYGTLRTFADQLDYDDIKDLLNETLDEEAAADDKLTDIAVDIVNPEAAEAAVVVTDGYRK